MSAHMVTTTHIRALVSAAVAHDTHKQLKPPPWVELAERYPEAFARTVYRDPRDGALRANESAIRHGWLHHFEDELGRALYIANADSIVARYPATEEQPGDGRTRYPDMWGEAEGFAEDVLGHRHAYVEKPALELIKAVSHLDYQACEPSDYRTSWCAGFLEALRELVIGVATDACPWGYDDPEDGAPEPGTAGAPISIMSMLPGGSNASRKG